MSEMKKLTINGASFEIVDEQARLGVQEAKELANGAVQVAESSLTRAKEYTDEKVAQLMNNSSEAVDSIMELATAMAENEGVVDALEQAIGTKANQSDLNSHINNFENPHNINKGTLGLDKVENKSSAEIIDEITKDDITGALGFTPVNAGEVNSAISSAIASKANISDLNSHVNDRNNPHGITPSQIGAPTIEEMNSAIASIPVPDVSAQINEHNVDANAHANAFGNYYTKSQIDNLELISVADIDAICSATTRVYRVSATMGGF